MATDPGKQWIINLQEGGYQHHCKSSSDVRRIARLGNAWRRILRITKIRPPADAFEIGCGGAEKMATLALNGFSVSGIDISHDVLGRAQQFIADIERVSNRQLAVRLIEGDFFSHGVRQQFDLVYHFGVVEHYLDPETRDKFWYQAVKLTRPGGWVISVVPCGRHIMRKMMRERELLGYQKRLAEIDYGCATHLDEFKRAGLVNLCAFPHGFFFFLSGHPNWLVRKILFPMLFVLGSAIGPWMPLPLTVKEKLAHSLIVAGQRPNMP